MVCSEVRKRVDSLISMYDLDTTSDIFEMVGVAPVDQVSTISKKVES